MPFVLFRTTQVVCPGDIAWRPTPNIHEYQWPGRHACTVAPSEASGPHLAMFGSCPGCGAIDDGCRVCISGNWERACA